MDDNRLVQIALEQHGVVGIQQGPFVDITPTDLRREARRGSARRLGPGVYRIGGAAPTFEQSVIAVLLQSDHDARASHRSAARLHGLDGFRTCPVIEITMPLTANLAVPRHTVVHRSGRLDLESLAWAGEIATMSVERTLVDLGAVVPAVLVEAAVESAIRLGLTTETKLRLAIDRGGGRGCRGVATLRRVLAVRAPGGAAGSTLEVHLLDAIRAAGLPMPVRQFELRLPRGIVLKLDLAYVDEAVSIEGRGFEPHGGRRSFYDDMERRNLLIAHGWLPLEVGWCDVRDRPHTVVERLRRTLDGRRSRHE